MSAAIVSCGARCRVASLLLAGVAGALFGAGLLISGMTEPAKVIGFLDVTSGWDPSLAFVMGGAALVYAVAFRIVRGRRATPWFEGGFHLPTRRDVDAPLIAGAALFGIGWGLAGLCPGPGLVSAAAGTSTGLAFVLAMLAGMLAQHALARRMAAEARSLQPTTVRGRPRTRASTATRSDRSCASRRRS